MVGVEGSGRRRKKRRSAPAWTVTILGQFSRSEKSSKALNCEELIINSVVSVIAHPKYRHFDMTGRFAEHSTNFILNYQFVSVNKHLGDSSTNRY